MIFVSLKQHSTTEPQEIEIKRIFTHSFINLTLNLFPVYSNQLKYQDPKVFFIFFGNNQTFTTFTKKKSLSIAM